jgi:hypothetical protein
VRVPRVVLLRRRLAAGRGSQHQPLHVRKHTHTPGPPPPLPWTAMEAITCGGPKTPAPSRQNRPPHKCSALPGCPSPVRHPVSQRCRRCIRTTQVKDTCCRSAT